MSVPNSNFILQDITQNFKTYRIDYPLTQKELSEKSGVSIRSIQSFENGKGIQFINFIKLLNALDLQNNLSLLIPDTKNRPSSFLKKEKQKQRIRVSKKSQQKNPFIWEEDK